MGSPCSGNVEKKLIFDDQIEVPMCENHWNEHCLVMKLAEAGHDIEELLRMTHEQRVALDIMSTGEENND